METATTAAPKMRTLTEVRARLKTLRAELTARENSYWPERKRLWQEECGEAISLKTPGIRYAGGHPYVPSSFTGPKEKAFEAAHERWVLIARGQIEVLEWVLLKESK